MVSFIKYFIIEEKPLLTTNFEIHDLRFESGLLENFFSIIYEETAYKAYYSSIIMDTHHSELRMLHHYVQKPNRLRVKVRLLLFWVMDAPKIS